MIKVILLLLASVSLHSKDNHPCDHLFMDENHGATIGVNLLDAGENSKAAQYFKDELAYEKSLGCNGIEAPKYEYLYITIANYRMGNYVEAKKYLYQMINMEELYYAYDELIPSYAFLIANKTGDKVLFSKGLTYIEPKLSYGDYADFERAALAHALAHMKLDEKLMQVAQKKLLMLQR